MSQIKNVQTFLNNIDMNTANRIINLAAPTIASDAATKGYVDAAISGDAATWSTFPATQAVSMASHQINNLTDPTLAQDAATKAYVDSVAGNPFVAMSASSTATTPTALATIAVATDTTVTISGQFASRGVATTDASSGQFFASATNAAGVLTLIGTPFILNNPSSTQTFDVVVSGTNLIVQVVGLAGTTINWSGAYTKSVQA